MSTIFDAAPLWRSSIGFDYLIDLLEQATKAEESVKYPPYNIEHVGDNTYRLTLAVAGWLPNEITITTVPNMLVVAGNKAEPEDTQYLHRGIPVSAFEHRFRLADHMQVREAKMTSGLLTIDVVREMPEALKPRQIQIADRNEPKAIERPQAA